MEMSKKCIYLVSLLLTVGPLNAFSQGLEDEEELLGLYGDEDMISIATGSRQPIAKAPAVASVITAADIHAMGATDLDQILETVPGLHVAYNNLYNPIYIFRGIYSSNNPQVLVLVNGISIGNLFQGDRSIAWGGMPVEAIARIEVIRGPGSAVYGADAFAGVINIITKSADDIQRNEAGLRAGSYSTTDAWLIHASSFGATDAALIMEYHKTDGADEIITQDTQTGLDFLAGTNASFAPGPVNLRRENFDLRIDLQRQDWTLRTGLQQRRHRGSGAGIAQAINPNNFDRSLRWNADLSYNNGHTFDDVDLEAQLSYFHSHHQIEGSNQVFPPGVNLGAGVYPNGFIGNPEAWERQMRFNASAFFTGLARHQFRLGAGYFFGDLYRVKESKNFGPDPTTGLLIPPGGPVVDVSDTPFVYLREDDRTNYYGFAQYIGRFADDWELTLGVRYDHYSDFGSTVNPRAALVWSTTHKLTTKLLYGEAFRAPAFAETRAQNNPASLGNPNLDPEVISSLELVFDYQASDSLRLSANLFDYSWEDIIDFFPIGGGANQAQNAGQRDGQGFELEAHWQMNTSLGLTSNFAYVDAEDDFAGSTQTTANIPGKQFYLRADYDFFNHWRANVQFNWVMDRSRAATDPREAVDDYTNVDLTFGYRAPSGTWSFDVILRNALDEDIREPNPSGSIPNDYPLADRNAAATLRFNF